MTPGELLLAVDGSGTRTQALLTDLQGKTLARGFGPSSNLHSVGFDAFARALTTAIEGAVMNALGPRGSPEGPSWRNARIAAACFGLAGVDGPEDEAQVSRWVREQGIAERFLVVNDSELIVAGGTPEGFGVALISGAGSVCLGRAANGRTARVGGWGPLLGDEGSGYQMALSALRLATQTADGRAESKALLEAVLRHWSLPDARALIRHIYAPAMTQADIAGLAAAVLELASNGDPAASAIANDSARELARQVDAVVRKLGLSRPPLALSGALLRGAMRQLVLAAIESEMGATAYVADPCKGAVALGRRLLTAPPGPERGLT
jgi:N-acetylglucosamine kinase-like BadF-type ATPase